MKLGLFMPGQGYQKAGLLAPFVEKFPGLIGELVKQVDASLPSLNLSKALLDPDYQGDVTPTYIAQPLLLSATYGMYKTIEPELRRYKIRYAAGHSLGQFTAWTVAGNLPFAQALTLVHERGLAMQKAVEDLDTGMTLVMTPRGATDFIAELTELARKHELDLSAFNADSRTAVSGRKEAIAALLAELKTRHRRVTSIALDVAGAFHSRYMAPAQPRLTELAAQADWAFPGEFDVVSNSTGRPFESLEEIRASVPEALVAPVQWTASSTFIGNSVDRIVSIGPGHFARKWQWGDDKLRFYTEPGELDLD